LGGSGTDRAQYSDATAGLTVDLLTPANNTGIAAGDTYSSIENLFGSSFNDQLSGDGSANALFGSSGNDRLIGGIGADQLTGGADADTFIFQSLAESTVADTGRDFILDFSRTEGDKIDVSQIDANTGAAGDQAFTFIGAASFSGVAGQLRAVVTATNTLVSGDVNGDSVADFSILVNGTTPLQATDFTP